MTDCKYSENTENFFTGSSFYFLLSSQVSKSYSDIKLGNKIFILWLEKKPLHVAPRPNEKSLDCRILAFYLSVSCLSVL